MQDSNGSLGAAVVEGPTATEVATSFTLFQIEESIALLAESAEESGLTPEIEQALVTYLEGGLEKRDRVADFIRYCEWMAELAKVEAKRLQTRQEQPFVCLTRLRRCESV